MVLDFVVGISQASRRKKLELTLLEFLVVQSVVVLGSVRMAVGLAVGLAVAG